MNERSGIPWTGPESCRGVKRTPIPPGGILEQAEKIFAGKGFHETTMAQIGASLRFLDRKPLTIFSAGKEDLYSLMVMEKVRLMYDEIMEAGEPGGIHRRQIRLS